MLEQHEVAAYLLKRRLVSRRSIVSGQLRIADASRRNRNFRVSGAPGESYLLKQGIAADSADTLANEVALYRRLVVAPRPIASCVPRVYGYDRARGVLILEWIEGGQDLYRYHAARAGCSTTLAAALGRSLAALHGVGPDDEDLRRDAPWVLALHRPPLEALRYLSAASIELIKLIQADEPLMAGLDELRDGFRAEALVHRDVKWENCVAHPSPGGMRATRIKLVDWEMAGWGDPGFDVGSAFSDVVGHWLASVPARPLASLQPAIAALWRAYARARGLNGEHASRLLHRAVGYAGARLLQNAFEHTQDAPRMTAAIARSVQVSHDLLAGPRQAAVRLLGNCTVTSFHDRYHAQVIAALGAADARPPAAYLWFGRRFAVPPGGDDARELLVAQLAERLYTDFYLAGAPRPPRDEPPAIDDDHSAFRRALSQANNGRGSWQAGWRVAAVEEDEDEAQEAIDVVRPDGLRLFAPAVDCRAEERIAAGAQVDVRVPKELMGLSPGLYIAAGDSPWPQPAGPRVRLCWSIAAAGAVAFLARVSYALNGAGVPFSLELPDDPARYGRGAGASLLLARADFAATIKLVRPLMRALATHLADTAPAFTKPLARGLAVAEEPGVGDGVGFGEHRCRLLAAAIVAARERGARTIEDRHAIVVEHFGAAGLTLDAPYLEPGSADAYDHS